MEVKKEETVDVKSCTFSPSHIEEKSCPSVRIKAEPCDDEQNASDLVPGSVNTQDPGKYVCMSKCEKDDVSFSKEEKGIADNTSESSIKQEEYEFGKGVVVMRGEDFVVEIDPNYESEDETEMESEVKMEYKVKVEFESESESGEMEMCVDSIGDMPGVPSYRQGSACLASSGEVAVDVRGRCGSSERSVRSSCGQPCVGAAVSAPSTASNSWEAGVVECPPGGNVSAPVQRNRDSGNGSGGSEDEVCPGCGKEGVPCPVCLVVSGENIRVEGSPKTVHRGKGGKFVCSECGKSFGYKSQLMNHLSAVHRGEKNFPCSECDKAYGHKFDLTRHVTAVHRGKKFPCSDCGKVFRYEKYLRTHKSGVHRGLRNYPCSECDKTFSQRAYLMRHVSSVHRGETFPCSECDKAFSQRAHLMRHLSTVHRGEKKFSCPECGRAFGHRSSLNVHLKRVHKRTKNPSTSD